MGFLQSAGIKAAGQAVAKAGAQEFSFPEREIKVKKAKPGEHWSNPIDEQHPKVKRFFIKTFASATPETMGRALAENFEVKHRGGYDFSIREPGEKKWRVVDRKSWTDWIPFYGGDWSDILGDIFTGIGSVLGTAVTAPGIVTSAAGAAGGAAAAETIKQGIGSLLGSGVTPGEAAKSVAFEAGAGAVGDVAGKLLIDPLVKGGVKIAKRGLLGNAAEVAERNAAKMADYEKTLATAAPIREAAPEGMGVKEQVKKGHMTLAEAATKASERGDEKLAEWVMKQDPTNLATRAPDIARPELEKATHGLLGGLARKGETAADELALAETRGMQELLDTSDDVLRQQAVDLGIETTRKTTVKEVKDAIVSQHESSVKEGIKAAQKELDRASAVMKRKTGVEGGLAKTAKETAERKLSDLKDIASRGPSRTAAELLEKSEKLAQEMNTGTDLGKLEAQRLGIDLDLPHEAVAQKVFKAQSPEKVQAVRGQVDRVMEGIEPDAYMEADYVAQQASKEGRGAAGEARTFKGTQKAPLDPGKYREAVAEAEGKSTAELQSLLRRSGWEGEIPQDREALVFNLYETKFGKSGVGSPEALTGPEFLESMYNVESKRKGFNPMETIRKENIAEIRAGGVRGGPATLAHTGREALAPSKLRSAALAARPGVRVAGKGLAGLGAILEAPAKGVAAIGQRMAPEWAAKLTQDPKRQLGAGLAGAWFGTPGAGALGAIGAFGVLGGGIKKVGHAIAADHSGQMLIRLASKAPAELAEKLLKPVEILAEKGPMGYKAAVFTLFHDPDARAWLVENSSP